MNSGEHKDLAGTEKWKQSKRIATGQEYSWLGEVARCEYSVAGEAWRTRRCNAGIEAKWFGDVAGRDVC